VQDRRSLKDEQKREQEKATQKRINDRKESPFPNVKNVHEHELVSLEAHQQAQRNTQAAQHEQELLFQSIQLEEYRQLIEEQLAQRHNLTNFQQKEQNTKGLSPELLNKQKKERQSLDNKQAEIRKQFNEKQEKKSDHHVKHPSETLKELKQRHINETEKLTQLHNEQNKKLAEKQWQEFKEKGTSKELREQFKEEHSKLKQQQEIERQLLSNLRNKEMLLHEQQRIERANLIKAHSLQKIILAERQQREQQNQSESDKLRKVLDREKVALNQRQNAERREQAECHAKERVIQNRQKYEENQVNRKHAEQQSQLREQQERELIQKGDTKILRRAQEKDQQELHHRQELERQALSNRLQREQEQNKRQRKEYEKLVKTQESERKQQEERQLKEQQAQKNNEKISQVNEREQAALRNRHEAERQALQTKHELEQAMLNRQKQEEKTLAEIHDKQVKMQHLLQQREAINTKEPQLLRQLHNRERETLIKRQEAERQAQIERHGRESTLQKRQVQEASQRFKAQEEEIMRVLKQQQLIHKKLLNTPNQIEVHQVSLQELRKRHNKELQMQNTTHQWERLLQSKQMREEKQLFDKYQREFKKLKAHYSFDQNMTDSKRRNQLEEYLKKINALYTRQQKSIDDKSKAHKQQRLQFEQIQEQIEETQVGRLTEKDINTLLRRQKQIQKHADLLVGIEKHSFKDLLKNMAKQEEVDIVWRNVKTELLSTIKPHLKYIEEILRRFKQDNKNENENRRLEKIVERVGDQLDVRQIERTVLQMLDRNIYSSIDSMVDALTDTQKTITELNAKQEITDNVEERTNNSRLLRLHKDYLSEFYIENMVAIYTVASTLRLSMHNIYSKLVDGLDGFNNSRAKKRSLALIKYADDIIQSRNIDVPSLIKIYDIGLSTERSLTKAEQFLHKYIHSESKQIFNFVERFAVIKGMDRVVREALSDSVQKRNGAALVIDYALKRWAEGNVPSSLMFEMSRGPYQKVESRNGASNWTQRGTEAQRDIDMWAEGVCYEFKSDAPRTRYVTGKDKKGFGQLEIDLIHALVGSKPNVAFSDLTKLKWVFDRRKLAKGTSSEDIANKYFYALKENNLFKEWKRLGELHNALKEIIIIWPPNDD
jgi:hypothetical protein